MVRRILPRTDLGRQMAGGFEEEYGDVLKNIEFAIVGVYRRAPELIDYEVDAALSALIARYRAEADGREPRSPQLDERNQEVYDAVETMCEWRLGRGHLDAEGDAGAPPPKTLDETGACLKRIRKSVGRWTKQGGRQGT